MNFGNLRREAADKKRDETAALSRTGEEIKARAMDKIDKLIESSKSKIRELQEKREELVSSKITRAELMSNAIAAFRKQRKRYLQEVVAAHLRSCQGAGVEPFTHTAMRLDFFNESVAFGVFFLAASEEDIKDAGALVSDEGALAAKERDAQINMIEKEISEIKSDMEKNLERVRAEQ